MGEFQKHTLSERKQIPKVSTLYDLIYEVLEKKKELTMTETFSSSCTVFKRQTTVRYAFFQSSD